MAKQSGIDDSEHSIPAFSPVCTFCKWWADNQVGRFCKAYPDGKGIPLPIWQGQNTHQTPYAGDHGVTFKRDPMFSQATVDQAFAELARRQGTEPGQS